MASVKEAPELATPNMEDLTEGRDTTGHNTTIPPQGNTTATPIAVELSKEEVEERIRTGTFPVLRTVPGNVLVPMDYPRLANTYYTFKFRSDDVVVMSYPKTGTNWTASTVWALMNVERLHQSKDLRQTDMYYSLDFDLLCPFINISDEEYDRLKEKHRKSCPDGDPDEGLMMQLMEAHTGSPRIIFTHLTFPLLNPNLLDTCKVVYVVRNPKDVCLSLYNLMKAMSLNMTSPTLDIIAKRFMGGELIYGCYWNHIRQATGLKGNNNLHFLIFEDMKTDPIAELAKLSTFLGLSLTQEQLVRVKEHTSFKAMKERLGAKPFLQLAGGQNFCHKGQVGGWAEEASLQLNQKMEAWIAENSSDIGLKLRYH